MGEMNKANGKIILPESISSVKIINNALKEVLNPSVNDYIDDSWILDPYEENYNCFESALALVEGREINYHHKPNDWDLHPYLAQEELFRNVSESPNSFNFGRTLITFWDKRGMSHAATYLGTSSGGTIYTWSKNGRVTAPYIMKLSETSRLWGGVKNFYNYIGQN
jgi:hypothetical protein